MGNSSTSSSAVTLFQKPSRRGCRAVRRGRKFSRKRKKVSLLAICDGHLVYMNLMALILISGRLSRLLKRREDSKSLTMSAAGVTQSAKVRSTSSSPVYMPTNVHQQSPADDWTDWTSFTLELEVHPIIPSDPTTSRYIFKTKLNCIVSEVLVLMRKGVYIRWWWIACQASLTRLDVMLWAKRENRFIMLIR